MQRGEVRIDDPLIAANPLPRTSLHRALTTGQLGWFAASPDRLTLFLRVAGCPEALVSAWQAKLAELATAENPDPDPDPDEAPEPAPVGPPVGRRGRNSVPLLLLGSVGLLLAIFLLVLASYAQFYEVLGFEAGAVPVSPAGLASATFFAVLLVAGVTVLLLGAVVSGASLVPWTRSTRAATPASALAVILPAAGYLAAAASVPHPYNHLVAALTLMAGYGCQLRLINTQRPAHWLVGWAIGLPTAGLTWLVAISARAWSGSVWWLLVSLLVVTVAASVPLGWWLRRQRHRDGRAGPIAPAALLARLRAELFPSIRGILWTTMPEREARRVVAGLTGTVLVAPLVALGMVAYLVGSAGDAGAVAREYGYVPPGQRTPMIWSPPVAPATVSLRQPGVDPERVCGQSPQWSASLIHRDGQGSWVLLRPVAAEAAAPQLVWLAASDYSVRPVAGSAAPVEGRWTQPACRP